MKKIDQIREEMKNRDPEEDKKFFGDIDETIRLVMIMKRNMQKRKIKRAKAKCPRCAGHWHAILAGPKEHIHMSCDGTCGTMLMQ